MEKGLAEVILGYKRDPQVGPVVVLGVGGVLAEIYRDFALRLAPVTEEEAGAHDRGSEGPCRHPRLPRPAARRYRGAGAGRERLFAARAPRAARGGSRDQSRCIVKAEGEGVVAVDGLLVLGEQLTAGTIVTDKPSLMR